MLEEFEDVSDGANAAGSSVTAASAIQAAVSGEMMTSHADIYHGQRNAFPPGRVRRDAHNAKRISKNIVNSAFKHG